MDNFKNKTPPNGERSEESCEPSSRIVGIPVVVEPVVVRHPLPVLEVRVTDAQVVVGVAVCRECFL